MDADDEKLAIAAGRLRLALALHDDGVRLMRQNFRRRHPDETDDEIDERVRAWLLDRPPDAPGRSVSWPRRRS
jgi:hypothetical protein